MTQQEIDAIIEETIVGEWSKPIPGPAKAAFGKIIEQHGDRMFLSAIVAYRDANGGSSAPQPTPLRLRDFLPRDKSQPKAQAKPLHWFDSTGEVSVGFFNQQPEPNEDVADWLLRVNIDRLRGGRMVDAKAVERLIGFFASNSYWCENFGQSERSREEVWLEAIDESKRVAKEQEARAERKRSVADLEKKMTGKEVAS